MSFEVKGGQQGEDLAEHHVKIKMFFRHFRGLPKSVVAPAVQPEPTKPKKKGYVVVEGRLNGGHTERFEFHQPSHLRFKLVREINQSEWFVDPAVLSRAMDTARTAKSDEVRFTVYGDEFALIRKQFKPGLEFLLKQMQL